MFGCLAGALLIGRTEQNPSALTGLVRRYPRPLNDLHVAKLRPPPLFGASNFYFNA